MTTPAATIPAATTPAATIPAPAATPLPYFIHRSKSNNLPIYEEGKNGGNLLQTRIRKVEGNVEALRLDIIAHLGIAPEKVHINNLTKHVVIKGHWRKKVEKVLTELKF